MGLAVDPAIRPAGRTSTSCTPTTTSWASGSAASPRWPSDPAILQRSLPEPAGRHDRRLRRLRPAVQADLVRRRHERRRGRPHRGLVPAVPQPLDGQPDVRAGGRPVRSAATAPASTAAADYGQLGGTLRAPRRRSTRAATRADAARRRPTAEGGALRSQDIRTTGDPTGLDGAILRVDPDTGAAWPTTRNSAAATPMPRRIIAYGLRNPFRFTIKPGTDDVWVGDVGFDTWEEINRIAGPDRRAPELRLAVLRGQRRPAVLSTTWASTCATA